MNIKEKISKICSEIDNALNKIPESIEDIQKRAALSVPLLKSIEDSLTVNQEKYFISLIMFLAF